MSKMKNFETKNCKVYPKKGMTIPDILTKNKRIEEPTELKLNPNEIKRAMQYGTVSAVAENGSETTLNPVNFNGLNGVINDPSKEPSKPGDEPGTGDDDPEYTDDEIRKDVNGVLYGDETESGDESDNA